MKWLVTLAAAMLTCGAWAQNYPVKPVRLIVGFPPGGPTDVTARITSQYLSESLGQQLVVDNRPGAGGTLGLTILTQAAPDGYTLSLVANGEVAIAPHLRKNLPYSALRDTVPITRIGWSQLVLVVHPSVAAKTVGDLVALAKAKPGAVNFASSGTGSTAHLCAELFKHMAGVDIVHVPYRGAGPALTDLIGGQVHMLITGYSGAVPHIKAGKLRPLGVTGSKRLVAAPALPTIGETVKGYEATSWYGIVAPAKTPRPIVMKVYNEMAAMLKRPEVVERLVALGIEPEGTSPERFREQIKEEIAKWGQVVKIAKVKIE